jgi:hypothetical protein
VLWAILVVGWENPCSDNFPIYLEFEKASDNPGASFKYNPVWYGEEDFCQLIRDNWKHY